MDHYENLKSLQKQSTYRQVYMLLEDTQDQAGTSTPADSSALVTGSKDILQHGNFIVLIFNHQYSRIM
jgi:hypothetical protein